MYLIQKNQKQETLSAALSGSTFSTQSHSIQTSISMRRLINKVYVASITAQASVQKSNLSPPCGKWSPGGLELIGTGQFNCEMSVSSPARRNLKPLRYSRRACERGGSWQDAEGKYSQLFFSRLSSERKGEGMSRWASWFLQAFNCLWYQLEERPEKNKEKVIRARFTKKAIKQACRELFVYFAVVSPNFWLNMK